MYPKSNATLNYNSSENLNNSQNYIQQQQQQQTVNVAQSQEQNHFSNISQPNPARRIKSKSRGFRGAGGRNMPNSYLTQTTSFNNLAQPAFIESSNGQSSATLTTA